MREKLSPRMNNPNKMIPHCQNTKLGFFDSIFSISSFDGERNAKEIEKGQDKNFLPSGPPWPEKRTLLYD